METWRRRGAIDVIRDAEWSGKRSDDAMTRRFFLSTIVGLWIGLGNFAVAAVQPGAASELIRRLGEQAIAALGAPGASLEEREARFRSLLSEGFDLAFIGRFVLGRYWRQATPEQRSDYLALFGEYVLQTYSARLGGYAGESMTILSERPAGTKDVVVSTRIARPSGPPIEAAWRVRATGGRYRIIDIMVEGVSMVVTQRSEFAAVVQRHGLQGLIEVLRARTTKLPAVAASK
jgi:phospholipid transport system substrate-binding protein